MDDRERAGVLANRARWDEAAPFHYIAYEEESGTYAAPDAPLQHTTTFERAHSLSDVVTAVLDAGLRLELLHEQSYTNAPWPWTVRGDDGYYRLPEGWPRFSLTYSLRARLPD